MLNGEMILSEILNSISILRHIKHVVALLSRMQFWGFSNCLIACMKNWPRCGCHSCAYFGFSVSQFAHAMRLRWYSIRRQCEQYPIVASACVKKDSCANYKIDVQPREWWQQQRSKINGNGNGNAYVFASRNKPSAKFQVYALIPKILLHYRSAIKIQSTKLWSTL